MDDKKTFRDTFLRLIALLGVILVLLLGAWGIILLAFNMSSVIANVGSSITSLVAGVGSSDGEEVEGESLSLNTPSANLASGQSFPVSWEHTDADGQYSHSLSYSCATGLSFKAPTPAGQTQTVACNTPFNYIGAPSAMTLSAQNSTKQAITATITVLATRLSDNAITASASSDVVINPALAAAPATPTAPTTGTPQAMYVPATRVSNLYGYPDLSVRIISVNSLSSVQGRTVAQFEVVNVGSNTAAPGWNFEAELPLNPTYEYSSPRQQALYPGDKIVYTLTFDEGRRQYDSRYEDECEYWFDNRDDRDWDEDDDEWYEDRCEDYDRYDDRDSRGGRMTITADPNNYVRELNERNNTVSASVR